MAGSIVTSTVVLPAKQFQSHAPTGTPPLVVASTTVVTNLNADLLDGAHGADYRDAAKLTGTVASARLAGAYTGITAVGTLTGLNLSDALNFAGTAAIREAGTERGRIVGGALRWGTTAGLGGAGDIAVAAGKTIGCIDRGGAVLLGIRSDPDNDFVLNINTGSAVNSGGYVRLPYGTVPPAGSAGRNGCAGVNEGNHKFYYVSGGIRYEILGTVAG